MKYDKPRQSENDLQIQVANYLDMTGWCWFHYPAGGHRHKVVAGKLKAMGTKKGVPDVMIFEKWTRELGAECKCAECNTECGFGICIELKVKGQYPRAEQKLWLAALKERGWITAVCRSLDEVREVVSVLRGAL